ncbi:MAG: hypothetical protein ABWY58_07325 [Aeromicrobium sp.]
MSAASMATARIMETWAPGHDVVEATGGTASRWLTLVQAFAGPAGNEPVRLAGR